jgi:L-ascorbate metabolism protein UlaG (beta-lactamase superfamily)
LKTSELPPLDFVLLTHAHMDHLDVGTLRRFHRDVTVVTAAATADLLTPLRFRDVVEMGWGESRQFDTPAGGLSIEAFRVQHWGARMRHDVHRGFNGYVLERRGRRICIAGDTARTSFTAVGRKPTDVMVVPIGAYNPWIASHCTPEQAVEMANQARAQYVVPVHHQTFRLSREPMGEPIQRFRGALSRARIALSNVGETFVLPGAPPLDKPGGRPIETALIGTQDLRQGFQIAPLSLSRSLHPLRPIAVSCRSCRPDDTRNDARFERSTSTLRLAQLGLRFLRRFRLAACAIPGLVVLTLC